MKAMKAGILSAILLAALAGSAAQRNDETVAPVSSPAAAQDAAQVAPQPAAIPALPSAETASTAPNPHERMVCMVRHKLVMQPQYSVWDWLAFRVHGDQVELVGDIYNDGLKNAAVRSVGEIDGISEVIDHLNLLPPSASDDRIRHQVSDAIYTVGSMSRYAWSATPTIHIIVNGGSVRLEGAVDNVADRNEAAARSAKVSGVVGVTNNLAIDSD